MPRRRRQSADALLAGVPSKRVILKDFRDGYFPYDGAEIKEVLRATEGRVLAGPDPHAPAV